MKSICNMTNHTFTFTCEIYTYMHLLILIANFSQHYENLLISPFFIYHIIHISDMEIDCLLYKLYLQFL
jgi:hypothetical protein